MTKSFDMNSGRAGTKNTVMPIDGEQNQTQNPLIRWVLFSIFHLFLLVASALLGHFVALFITIGGQVDRAVIGPLPPPLSVVLTFVFFGTAAVFFHRRALLQTLHPYLPESSSGLSVLVALVAVAAILETLRIFLFMFLDYWPTDFPSYFYASLAMSRDQNPYDAELLADLAGRKVFPYLYPPFLAVCFRLLSAWPLEVASALWQCCQVVSLLVSMKLCLRLAASSTDSSRTAAVLAALLVPLGLPFYITAQHGSVSIIVAWLTILFFERLHSQKDITAGIALAFAAAIKAFPAILILYLIIKGRRRALVATGVSGALLLCFSLVFAGWDLHHHFLTQVTSNVGYAVTSTLGFDASFHPANQSINGFIGIYLSPFWGPLKFVIIAICLGLTLPALWLVWKRKTTVTDDAVILTLLMLLVSPITWIHHMVIIILPATVFASRLVDKTWRQKLWLLVPLAFTVILAGDLGRPIMPVKFFPFFSHSRLFAIVAIYAYAIVHLMRSQRQKTPRV